MLAGNRGLDGSNSAAEKISEAKESRESEAAIKIPLLFSESSNKVSPEELNDIKIPSVIK
jgi:hypothetical protein